MSTHTGTPTRRPLRTAAVVRLVACACACGAVVAASEGFGPLINATNNATGAHASTAVANASQTTTVPPTHTTTTTTTPSTTDTTITTTTTTTTATTTTTTTPPVATSVIIKFAASCFDQDAANVSAQVQQQMNRSNINAEDVLGLDVYCGSVLVVARMVRVQACNVGAGGTCVCTRVASRACVRACMHGQPHA